MQIEDYFNKYNGYNIVFDPIPSYSGIWYFSYKNIIENSKDDLFKNFYLKYFFLKMNDIFKYRVDLKIGFLSIENDNRMGRKLVFNKIDFYLKVFRFLDTDLERLNKNEMQYETYYNNLVNKMSLDDESLNAYLSDEFVEKLKKLKDIKENGFASDYNDTLMKTYEKRKKNMSFNEYLNSVIDKCHKLQNGLLYVKDFFDLKVNTKELYECFDPNVFYLLFAVIFYENAKNNLNNINNYLPFLNLYYDYIKENPTNIRVKYEWQNGKKEIIDINKFIKYYEELKSNNIFNMELPKVDDKEIYKDINLVESLNILYKDKSIKNISKDALINKNDYIDYLNDTNHIDIYDIGNDWVAYLYPNESIIIENYNNQNNYCTYTLNISSFIELCNSDNMFEYINTLSSSELKRIFHSSKNNWIRNIDKIINGTYNAEDALRYINGVTG